MTFRYMTALVLTGWVCTFACRGEDEHEEPDGAGGSGEAGHAEVEGGKPSAGGHTANAGRNNSAGGVSSSAGALGTFDSGGAGAAGEASGGNGGRGGEAGVTQGGTTSDGVGGSSNAGAAGEGGSSGLWCGQCWMEQVCSWSAGASSCTCARGFSGSSCADIDECEQNPCSGACTNLPGTYACDCPAAFAGPTCSERRFQGIGVLTGHDSSEVVALSRDGKRAIGNSRLASVSSAVRFDVASALLTNVAPTDASSSAALALSGDGNIVIGRTNSNYVWTSTGTRSLMGPLADANIREVSSDASVFVGSRAGDDGIERAFRATESNFEVIHCGNDAAAGQAVSVSADGSVAAVHCDGSEGLRWSATYGISPLQKIWSANPEPTHVSSDGTTIVGFGDIGADISASRITVVNGLVSVCKPTK